MDRATLLFLFLACLTLATNGNNVTDCHAVKCAWMEEKICPGEFFPKEPSIGKCCAFCLVIVGESTLHITFCQPETPGSNLTLIYRLSINDLYNFGDLLGSNCARRNIQMFGH
jgi:hypothetical protein